MENGTQENKEEKKGALPRINFRPLLFGAVALCFGIFLYGKIAFGGFSFSDLLFVFLLLLFAVFPLSVKRSAALFAAFLLFFGAGMGLSHLYTTRFENRAEEGSYLLMGTASSVTVYDGYSSCTLTRLFLDGEEIKGKCRITLGDEIRTGDIITAQVTITHTDLSDFSSNAYTRSLFTSNTRYKASASSYEKTGKSSNVFYKLNAALYDVLSENMHEEEAGVAYALLTGNSSAMDEGVSTAARYGGIAHIFAVSGLHIGILYSTIFFLAKPLKKYRFLPAALSAFAYSGLCGFTVSSLRAAIMCMALGTNRALGRKTDFLNQISLAALCTLLLFPSQFFSAGFRLSYGACLGLALFSGTFTRLLQKIRVPKMIGGYLSASVSVQLFTFPVLIESFGYVSVWGTLLNLVVVPCLPVLFLTLLICALLALIIPPAATFFLAFPEGLLSVLLYVLSAVDLSLILSGFALGAGTAVWLCGCVFVSTRVRMRTSARALLFSAFAALFAVCVFMENVVFYGCEITVYDRDGENAALVKTRKESVLIIDGDLSLSDCQDFLARNYTGTLDVVIVLSESEMAAINVAAFLNAGLVFAKEELTTGLRETAVSFGEVITVGGLTFRYQSDSKLVMFCEGVVAEIDFEGEETLKTDLFIGDGLGDLKFYLKDGIIKTR